MTTDLQRIETITAAAAGKIGTELFFTFPEVMQVIKQCSANGIAVLGVETFATESQGLRASGCSDYDLRLRAKWPRVESANWHEYVNDNNLMAESYVRQNPAGDDHVYVLTTASLREFRDIQR